MKFKGLKALDNNGNTRFVKTFAEVKNLANVSTEYTFEVPAKLENKIWAVAEILFGDVDKVELLLKYNNLKPHKLPTGTILKIPNLSEYNNSDKVEETKANTNQTTSDITAKENKQAIAITGNGRLTFTSKRNN